MAVKFKSEIRINIGLDENKVPEAIFWSADDGNIKDREVKATFLSVWDSNDKETFRVNLWTKDMPVDEIKQFFHQTLVSMQESLKTATGDEKLADTMKDFNDYFLENMMKG